MNTTGRRLKRIRKLHGCKPTAELAALCRVDVSTLWRWVGGMEPQGNNEARLQELESSQPTEGIGSDSQGRATAEADSSAPSVDPSTISRPARRGTRRGRARGAEPSAPPATSRED